MTPHIKKIINVFPIEFFQLCGICEREALLLVGQAEPGHRGNVSRPDQADAGKGAAGGRTEDGL